MKRSLSQKGFKLTELLLVVAILVLLAGIVWVASHSVREGAARTHCMQNLRQIAIATHQYIADYQIIYQTPLSLRNCRAIAEHRVSYRLWRPSRENPTRQT